MEKKTVILHNGIKLSYIKEGQGKNLLLLHGNRDSKENFKELIEDLKKDYTVIAVDLRGHGDSDKPKKGYSFEAMVEDVEEFIEYLGLDTINIIGHSLGASIAMQLLINDTNQLFDKVVLMGTAAKFVPFFRPTMIKKENVEKTDLESTSIQESIHNSLRPYFIVEKYNSIEPMIFSNWEKMPPYVHQALVMQLKHPDMTDKLDKVTNKTLVIAGSVDKVTPVDQCKEVADLIHDSELEVIEGCGHFMYLEEEKKVYKIISDFLEEE